jgi:hypothetical protein
MVFRLLFSTQDDHFDGDAAPVVIAAAAEYDDETVAAAISCWNITSQTDMMRS